jgi:hypothetical protein
VNVPSQKCLLAALAVAALSATSCVSHTHTVGLGATGTGEASARQYYFLFGFVRVNDVDAQRLAPDLTSYTIDTSYGFIDMLIAPFLLPFTVTTRTVVVRT